MIIIQAMNDLQSTAVSLTKIPPALKSTCFHGVGARSDFNKFGRNGVLTGAIVFELQILQEVFSIGRRVVHGNHTRTLLRCVGL